MRIDHRSRRRAGVALMLSSLIVAAMAALGGPAIAQESERQTAEITKEATYYAPRGEVAPNTLVSEFPPGVICVVRPELCPDAAEPVFGPVEDGITGALEAEEEQQPTQPGPGASNPDTLPISATGGKPDYRSAFSIDLPTVADDQVIDRFVLHLTVGDPTYSQGSPTFRQAVLAAFTCVRGCQEDQFEKIPDAEKADDDLLDLEICPIVSGAAWTAERGQPASAIPEVDCITGQNSSYAEDNSEVSFDLTLFFSTLHDLGGEFNGFLIRPAGLPNLAYGDPDPSYNKMVSLEKAVTYELATSDAPEDYDFDFGGGGDTASGGGFTPTDTSTDSGGGFSTPPSTGGGDLFSSPVTTDPEPAPAPEVANPAPTGGAEQPLVADQAAADPLEQPGSAWYVWLLVPVFGAGMFLTAQSLTAAPIVAEAAGRSGAMTRLLEKRSATDLSGPELVSF